MGILVERFARMPRTASERRVVLEYIERDVCARLNLSPDSPKLGNLKVDAYSVGGRARDFITVFEIGEAGREPLRYGLKDAHRSNEPWVAQKASDLGIGPCVLAVFKGEGWDKNGHILEEYLPDRLNIKHRGKVTLEEWASGNWELIWGRERDPGLSTLSNGERRRWGAYLAEFFMKFALPEGEWLHHNDERPEHIYIMGEGGGIEIRMVDWGRGGVCHPEDFERWASGQFEWFYHNLSFNDPDIWRDFINSLAGKKVPASKIKGEKMAERLALAYMEFIRSETHDGGDHGLSSMFVGRFLGFHMRVGRLKLDLGPFGDFLHSHQTLSGDALAFNFRKWWVWEGGKRGVEEWKKRRLSAFVL